MAASVTVIQPRILAKLIYDELQKSPVRKVFTDEFVRTLASVLARAAWKEGFRQTEPPDHPVNPGQQTMFKEGA